MNSLQLPFPNCTVSETNTQPYSFGSVLHCSDCAQRHEKRSYTVKLQGLEGDLYIFV